MSDTQAKRSRNSYFLHVFKISGIYQLNIGYKTSKGVMRPLSSCKSTVNVKIPFGAPSECLHRTKNKGLDNEMSEFKMTNERRQEIALKDTLLNNLQLGDNNFNKLITSLSTGAGSRTALAMYISLVNRSEGFIFHRSGIHDNNGFYLADKTSRDDILSDVGGSRLEYREFIEAAKNSASEVCNAEADIEIIRNNLNIKRKALDDKREEPLKAPKLSKMAYVEVCEKKELEDVDGLEKKYQNSFCGVGHIPLANIEIPSQLTSVVDSSAERVEFIKTSIRKRYIPALGTLVVCPTGNELKMITDNNGKKKIDMKNQKFFVVQKVKFLKAMKDLDKSGEFRKLYGHRNGEVLCYILKSNSSELIQYGNMTENFVSGQFSRKTLPQDIFHHFNCLLQMDDSVKALKVVDRMSRLCCIGPEDICAMLKICKWSSSGFSKFIQVLRKYESYQTSDVSSTRGLQTRIAHGEKLNVSNLLLRLLGKCTEAYFVEHCSKVIDGQLSLRQLAENNAEALAVEKTYEVLSKIADYQSVDILRRLHPGKFEDENMMQYKGAVYNDRGKNLKAKELEKYYNFVVNGPVAKSFDTPVDFKIVTSVEEIFDDIDTMLEIDMVLFNMEYLDTSSCDKILLSIFEGNKSFHVGLFMFSNESDYFSMIRDIRKKICDEDLKDFKTWPLMFNRPVESEEREVENVQFGVIVGKFLVSEKPLMMQYSNVSKLPNIVESICPSGARVLSVSHSGMAVHQVHNLKQTWKVLYCGAQSDIDALKKQLVISKRPIPDLDDEGGDDQVNTNDRDVASTSVTPIKPTLDQQSLTYNDLKTPEDVYNFDCSGKFKTLLALKRVSSTLPVSKQLQFDQDFVQEFHSELSDDQFS